MTTFGILMLIGALIGHMAVTVTTLDVLYGPGWLVRSLLELRRVSHDLWILAGTPWLAWLVHRYGLLSTGDWFALPPMLFGYLVCCAGIGCVLVPAVMIARTLRRLPNAQLSNHGRVIDMAQRLGRL